MSQTPLLKTLHWLSISPSVQIQTEYGLQGPSGHGLSLPFYLICWLMIPRSYSSQIGRELEVWAPYVTRILAQMKLWEQTFYFVVSYVLWNIHRAIAYSLDLYTLPQWSKNEKSDIFVNNWDWGNASVCKIRDVLIVSELLYNITYPWFLIEQCYSQIRELYLEATERPSGSERWSHWNVDWVVS